MEELDGNARVNTLAIKLSKIKTETLGNTLGQVLYTALLYTMTDKVAELHLKKSADTLCNVQALAPVDFLAYTLACKKEETHAATPEVMKRLKHC